MLQFRTDLRICIQDQFFHFEKWGVLDINITERIVDEYSWDF